MQRTKKCLLINDEVPIFAEIFHHLISLYIIGEKLHSINTRFSLKKMLPYEFEISFVKLYIIIIIIIIIKIIVQLSLLRQNDCNLLCCEP